jgi:hypothetical protein
MRAIRVWLLFLLATACGGAQQQVQEKEFTVAASFNPIKECSTTAFGRFVRGVTCPSAELLFWSRELPADQMLLGLKTLLAAYGHTTEDRTLQINGRDAPAITYQVGSGDSPLLSSYALALDAPEGGSIEVQCFQRNGSVKPKRCVSLVDAFISQGLLRGEWPAVLARMPRKEPIVVDVAGRQIRLPSSCDELSLFDVDCHEGHVTVHRLERAEQLGQVLDAHLAATRDDTIKRERVLPCVVEGLAAECDVREYRLPFGDTRYMLSAAVTVRDTPLFVSCDARRSRIGEPPGAVCIQLFVFEEGVLEARDPEDEGQ